MDFLIIAIVVLLAIVFRPLRKPLGWTLAVIVLAVLMLRIQAGRAHADEARHAEALDRCVKQYEAAHPSPDQRTAWFEAAAHC